MLEPSEEAPRSVKNAARLVVCFGIGNALFIVLTAFVQRRWFFALWGLTCLAWPALFWTEIFKRSRWVWWLLVVGGGLLSGLYLVGLGVDLLRLMRGTPVPPLRLVSCGTTLLFVVPIVVLLLARPSREFFGRTP